MTYTHEPKGLEWINNVNAETLGLLVTQGCWIVGSLTLTFADYQLFMSGNESARQVGLILAGILTGGWTGKTIAGVFGANNKRKTAKEYGDVVEAQTRGKVAEAVVADVVAARKSGLHAAITREFAIPGKKGKK